MVNADESENRGLFQDCLATRVIEKLAPTNPSRKRVTKGRKNAIKPVLRPEEEAVNDVSELSDFIEYLADEIFLCLPNEVRGLSYSAAQDDPKLAEQYGLPLDSEVLDNIIRPLPLSIVDSLCSYNLINDATDIDRFLEPALESYVASATSPPSEYTPTVTASRPDGCEICSREHIPLTYHHLIPRQMHDKALKRGWHKEWELGKVAWLCRACHSYVHKIATNEELAKDWYDVDLLLEREDVQKWAGWIGKVRWKAR